MSDSDGKEMAGWILGILIAIGATIVVARQLFPLFMILSGITLLILIICAIFDFYNSDGYGTPASLYALMGFGICLGGMFVTYFIGYGIGGTSFGQATVDTYYAFTDIQDQIDNSINSIVDESCKTLDSQSCELLRTTAKTAKTVQEVRDLAANLKTAKSIAKKIDDNS